MSSFTLIKVERRYSEDSYFYFDEWFCQHVAMVRLRLGEYSSIRRFGLKKKTWILEAFDKDGQPHGHFNMRYSKPVVFRECPPGWIYGGNGLALFHPDRLRWPREGTIELDARMAAFSAELPAGSDPTELPTDRDPVEIGGTACSHVSTSASGAATSSAAQSSGQTGGNASYYTS